ncbi:MAG: hypothetical protein IKX54_05590 [Lachnospiraceae bacterium]|nr:hypothetical protein [Lachnospiraceae bacterium]
MTASQQELDCLRVYQSLKQVVSTMVENFDCDDETYTITFSVTGKPFDVVFKMTTHLSSQLLTVYSKLGFVVEEPYRAAYATNVARLNYDRMFSGTFDFSPEKGFTVFRIGVPYEKSLLSRELLESIIRMTHDNVVKYAPYLYDIARGIEACLPPEN